MKYLVSTHLNLENINVVKHLLRLFFAYNHKPIVGLECFSNL